MAGVEISRAYVGVGGADIRSVNSRGMVSVARKDREITRQDIERVLDAAQLGGRCPSDREILHAMPQEFIVDEQGGISDPLGMLGSRLEVSVHLVTGHATRGKTLLTCVNRAGIEVAGWCSSRWPPPRRCSPPTSASSARLLVDVGAGTTGCALFQDGEVQYSVGAADRRRPLHQRPGDGAAHAVRRGREDQGQARLLPGQHGRPTRRGSRCRRWPAAPPAWCRGAS